MFDPINPPVSSNGLEQDFVALVNSNPSGLRCSDPLNLMRERSTSSMPIHFNEPIQLSQLSSFESCQLSSEMNGNNINIVRGSTDDDFLRGSNGNDKLFGLAGDDLLLGKRGDDLLNGGTGNDRLVGGKGNDVLLDYDGGDIMTGGKGFDTFGLGGWGLPRSSTTIADFELGVDKLKLGRLGATFDTLTIQTNREGAVVSDQGNVLAVLSDVDASRLTAENFVFGDPELASKLQTTLNNSLMEVSAPGATQAIITPDGFMWAGAAGVSEVTQQTPMQPNDIFGLQSVTKTFTAATVLKLQEAGVLSLDDTIGKWLPEVAQNIPGGESITIRQILNGSSGIPADPVGNPSNAPGSEPSSTPNSDPSGGLIDLYRNYLNGATEDVSPEELVASIYGQPRFSGRGSSSIWTYPDLANNIAGLIVEEATGSSFSSVLREQVLEPLGLNHTFFVGDEQIAGNVAHAYEDVIKADGSFGQDGVLEDYTGFLLATSFADGWANGAMYSSASDLAQFSSALFSGELLNANSIQDLTTFVEEGIPYEGNGYGLGVATFGDSSERIWGKSGEFAGYTASMRYFPDRNGATAVALVNTYNFATLDPDNLIIPARVVLGASLETLLEEPVSTESASQFLENGASNN